MKEKIRIVSLLSFPCENHGSASLHEANHIVILRIEDVTGRPPHRVTEDLKCLDEHASLDRNVQRTVDVQTLDLLDRPKLLVVDLSIAINMASRIISSTS